MSAVGRASMPLSRASKVGSSAAELEEKHLLSLPKRGDVCACWKVFDTSSWKERARGREVIIAPWSRHGAYAVCIWERLLMLPKFGNVMASKTEVTTSNGGHGVASTRSGEPREQAPRGEGCQDTFMAQPREKTWPAAFYPELGDHVHGKLGQRCWVHWGTRERHLWAPGIQGLVLDKVRGARGQV
jgi:hypothetical protein